MICLRCEIFILEKNIIIIKRFKAINMDCGVVVEWLH